jgi:hypothetical protein
VCVCENNWDATQSKINRIGTQAGITSCNYPQQKENYDRKQIKYYLNPLAFGYVASYASKKVVLHAEEVV